MNDNLELIKYMVFVNKHYNKQIFNFNLQGKLCVEVFLGKVLSDLDKLNNDTPLHIAAKSGNYDIIQEMDIAGLAN